MSLSATRYSTTAKPQPLNSKLDLAESQERSGRLSATGEYARRTPGFDNWWVLGREYSWPKTTGRMRRRRGPYERKKDGGGNRVEEPIWAVIGSGEVVRAIIRANTQESVGRLKSFWPNEAKLHPVGCREETMNQAVAEPKPINSFVSGLQKTGTFTPRTNPVHQKWILAVGLNSIALSLR
ncbi:hypothetical protein SAY87_016988 [Trapa incisa]|uniref:Uncharacterized protein n=1 Tax=Trapa incisa TaxID=236973 RepID=A0AAN7L6Y6_9MYRT|nr:hypothetical protein SAY87_016988 [Trapa incisa]